LRWNEQGHVRGMTAGARGQSRLPQLSSPNREERLDREKDHEKINILVTLVSRRELGSARQEGKASQSQVGYSDGKKPSEFWQLWGTSRQR
jgi:hypothetical protein